MKNYRLALIYERNSRVAQGERCLSVLARYSHLKIDQYNLKEIQSVTGGYDYYIRLDDGNYSDIVPSPLRPIAWWISDTHLKHPYRQIKSQVKSYDQVFLAQKDAVAQIYRDTGKDSHWLPWAADNLKDGESFLPDEKRVWDVCFIGTSGKFSLRKVVLETIQKYYPNSYVGRAEYSELSKYYAKSKIVVNYPIRHDVNMRYFEAMGAGSMLLSSRVEGNGIQELFKENETIAYYDLPPKKWTQRRDGFSIKTSSKTGGVQWKGKKEKRSDLTGNLRCQRSRWSQKVATKPQRWPGAWESMPTGFISGRGNLAIMEIRPLLAKAI